MTPGLARRLVEAGLKQFRVGDEDLSGQYLAEDVINEETGEVYLEAGDELTEEALADLKEAGVAETQDPVHRSGQRTLHQRHPEGGPEQVARRGADGHLPRHAPGRAADARQRGSDVQHPLLRRGTLRPLGRRTGEDERAAGPRGRGFGAHAAQGRHPRRRQDAGRAQGRDRRGRRHRPSRQPARALGGRADGEPVPNRPAARGARHPRAHGSARARFGHAARSHQRQAGGGGGAGVLRLLAAVPVHGPDQPAVRNHPQAQAVRAGSGRAHPRARRVRGARRAPHPLWPDLPDRDAGRPEYRPDQLARDVRPGEPLRFHRDALSQGGQRQGHR